MFYARVQQFDVTDTVEIFLKLNTPYLPPFLSKAAASNDYTTTTTNPSIQASDYLFLFPPRALTEATIRAAGSHHGTALRRGKVEDTRTRCCRMPGSGVGLLVAGGDEPRKGWGVPGRRGSSAAPPGAQTMRWARRSAKAKVGRQ